MFDAAYWVADVRNPVQFAQAVVAAAENHATFIEVSAHPLLTHALTDTLESASLAGCPRPERCTVTTTKRARSTLNSPACGRR